MIQQFVGYIRGNDARDKTWFASYIFRRTWEVGRVKVITSMRSTGGHMGRFGGGWNWQLGFQLGGTTLIINLLVMAIRITWKRPEPKEAIA